MMRLLQNMTFCSIILPLSPLALLFLVGPACAQQTQQQQQLAQQGPQRAAGFSWAQTGAELKQRLQALCP